MTAQPKSTVARRLAAVRAGVAGDRLVVEWLTRWLAVAFDPRARMLRKRRRALRWGLFFAVVCVLWILSTALLASWPTPIWVLLITGAIAAGAAWPSTLLLLRYRWLRSVPLPARRWAAIRKLPPPGSAARNAMVVLQTLERGLYSLLAVLERGSLLPADEITDLAATAERSVTAMAATAAHVAEMERTTRDAPGARAHLAPTISAFAAQLEAGVGQYNDMVTAAAHLVESMSTEDTSRWGASTPPDSSLRAFRHELADATDRLAGWAEAFDELGGLGALVERTAST